MAWMTDCGLLESSTPRAGGRLQRVPSPAQARIFIAGAYLHFCSGFRAHSGDLDEPAHGEQAFRSIASSEARGVLGRRRVGWLISVFAVCVKHAAYPFLDGRSSP